MPCGEITGEYSWRSSFLTGYMVCLEQMKRYFEETGFFDIAYETSIEDLEKYYNELMPKKI